MCLPCNFVKELIYFFCSRIIWQNNKTRLKTELHETRRYMHHYSHVLDSLNKRNCCKGNNIDRSTEIVQVKWTHILKGSGPGIKDPNLISNSLAVESLIKKKITTRHLLWQKKSLSLIKEESLLRYIKSRKNLFWLDEILLYKKFHEFHVICTFFMFCFPGITPSTFSSYRF